MQSLWIAAVSGVLSWASFFVSGSLGRWAPGIVFGLLVLAMRQRSATRFAALVALSTGVYRAAVYLATELYAGSVWSGVVSCAVSGVAGALVLSFGVNALLRERAAPRPALRAAAIGAIGGALIGLAVNAPDGSPSLHLLLASGFVVWQVGYVAAHRAPAGAPVEPPSPSQAGSERVA